MRFNVARTPRGVTAHLREGLDISSISIDREHLAGIVSPGGSVEIDLDGLTEIDCSGVQLLLAVRKEAVAKGGACRFIRPGEAARTAFSMLGLGHLLEEPEVGGTNHGS